VLSRCMFFSFHAVSGYYVLIESARRELISKG